MIYVLSLFEHFDLTNHQKLGLLLFLKVRVDEIMKFESFSCFTGTSMAHSIR